MNKLKIFFVTMPAILFMLFPVLFGQKVEDVGEYPTKAVFFEKLAKYITWPDESGILDTSQPFVISVIGENPFVAKKGKEKPEEWLRGVYEDKKIENKKVEIRYISDIEDIPGTHILFISKSEKKKLKEILAAATQHPVLTIADSDGFAKKGVHINFYLSKGRVNFEINETGIRSSGLKVSYHLLKIAKIVNRSKKRR
ncbi:MAG: YfiR family protein [bacterium]|nr:YfiR family protein [bacterium]